MINETMCFIPVVLTWVETGGEHVTVSEGVLTYHNSHGSTGIYWKARDTDAKHPTLQEIVPYRKELPSPNC